jgi:hypothetical protein
VPSGGLVGICDVESGKAAPLVGGPPGIVLHTVVDETPSGVIRDIVPVVLPTSGMEMVRNGLAGVVAPGDVGAAETEGNVPVVVPDADMEVDVEVTCTAKVAGAICPVGVAQVTTVPGVVGSEASGTDASVVSGTPGWIAAENGLGPLSGEDSMVPGVDESPMAVVPMVET